MCRRFFNQHRRSLLYQHNWNGAKRSTSLTQVSSYTPTFYSYGFTLPADLIKLISAHPTDDLNSTIPYTMQESGGTSASYILLSDSSQIYIQYIFDNQDMSTMSQGFRDVLAFAIARDLCLALSKSASKYELTDKQYRRALTLAKSVDGMEDYPDRMSEGSWVKSRYGLYTDKSRVEG